jgi:hypothetical protein
MTSPDAVDGHEQIVMIFSCSDWKPSDHLGIKILRIGLPCLALIPGCTPKRAARGFTGWVAGCRCRSPDPCLIIRAAGTRGREIPSENKEN